MSMDEGDDYSDEEDYEYTYSDDDDHDDGDVGSDDDGMMDVDEDDDGTGAAVAPAPPTESSSSESSRKKSTTGNSSNKRSSSAKSPSAHDRRGGRRRSGSSGGIGGGGDGNPNAAPMMMFPPVDGDSSSIRMLDAKDLMPIMKRRLHEVTEVLGVPESAAAVLMREHKWAKEALFETFYNDPDKAQSSCGVKARCQPPPPTKAAASASAPAGRTTRSSSSRKKSARKECEICLDEDGFAPEEMIGMPCGHEFCRDCWAGFMECALTKGPLCVRETCPQAGCKEVVTEEEVAKAAPDLLPKFQQYQLRSFVEMNGMTRWCPGPGCERVAVARGAGGLFADATGVAECDQCETCFCLKCGEEPHAPITCKDLARWAEKCRNESETANWILANTKPCPKCSSRIEKNQGCNHMTCSGCKYEFCWICMGNWTEHGANTGGYYKCNKYDPNAEDGDQSDAAKAKRELDRYLHYYKRYHAHAEAQKFAKRQLKETEARMVLLQESSENATWTDVEFLKTANQQLVECRKVLKYTYAFAYYLTEDGGKDKTKAMQKERFEHHQEMLERFTENLSELSEKPLAEMDRTDVVNQTRVVDRFMKNILKYVDDGLEE